MRSPAILVFLITVTTLVGCASVQVSQDYDPDAAVFLYGSWRWREPAQPSTGDLRVDNPLLDKRIRRAVERHLTGRHIRLRQTGPDLLVTYHLAIQPKIQSESYYSTVGIGSYYYPWYGGVGTETRIYQYDESQLTIDIHAAATGTLLWRGTGIYRFRTYKTPQAAAEDIQKTVDKILSQFPPDDKK